MQFLSKVSSTVTVKLSVIPPDYDPDCDEAEETHSGKAKKCDSKRDRYIKSICSLFGSIYAISACHSSGKIKTQKNPAIKDWIADNKKNGRPFLLNSENSPKLKRLQVNELW